MRTRRWSVEQAGKADEAEEEINAQRLRYQDEWTIGVYISCISAARTPYLRN